MAKSYNAFLVFHDWRRAFETLDGEDCKKILLAMFDYSEYGTEPPEFEGAAQMASLFIFPAMERRSKAVEAGRRGGNKRVENAASKADVDNCVENVVDKYEKHEFSTTLEPPLNPPSTPLEPKTRQDKTKQDEIKQNKIKQDEDEIKQSGFAADVSSVVAIAKSISKWLVIPAVVSEKTAREITHSGWTDDEYRRLFYTANECDFLQGRGERGWTASFDWLIEHRDDVVAGKYQGWNKPANGSGNGGSFDTDEFFKLALARSYKEFNVNEGDGDVTT